MNPIDPSAKTRLVPALQRSIVEAFSSEPLDRSDRETRGLLEWARAHLPRHFAKPPSGLHRWMATELDRMRTCRGRKLNVVGPRGSAKSTIATLAFVLRAALEGEEPYIWIVSDTKAQAQVYLESLKAELTDNKSLIDSYPATARRGDRWRAMGIELRNGVVIEAYGSGQRLRGRRRRENRPTLIVCDDLQNERHIASAAMRYASTDWFDGTLLRAGTKETNVVNVATALHRDAIAMRLTQTPGWESRTFRSIVHWPTAESLWKEWESLYCDTSNPQSAVNAQRFYAKNQTEMNAGAHVLWPDEENLYTLMRMRVEGGHAAFEREKQSSPIDSSRCEWPASYFDDAVWFDPWPNDLTLRTIALDPSKGGDARHGDYSAIVMLGIDADGVLHVEADLARRPTPQMVADGVAWCERFTPDAFGVESNQWQQLLAGEFLAEFGRRGLLGVTPCELNNHTNKEMRIRRLGPYLSQRRLRFKRGSPGTELLVDQLKDFPLGSHDDGPDALEMAVRLAEDVWRGRDENGALAVE